MAKSRLSASRNKNQPLTEPKAKDNVTSLDLTFELLSRGRQYSTKYNLLDWCHEQCDPQKPIAHPGLTHQCLYFEQPHTFEQILFIQTAEPALVGHA